MPTAAMLTLGVVAAVVATVMSFWTPPLTGPQLGIVVLAFLGQVLAARTIVEFRYFSVIPTRPIVVVVLFLAPLPVVPAVLIAGRAVAALVGPGTSRERLQAAAVQAALTSPVMVAVAVIATAGTGSATGAPLALVVGALVAQLTVEVTWRGLSARHRVTSREQAPLAVASAVVVDLLLIAMGLGGVAAAQTHWWYAGVVLAPIALLAVLISDQRGLDQLVVTAQTEARVDALTGLGNRRAWLEAVDSVAEQGRPSRRSPVGVVMADLNNLKVANDTLGHQVGDELIAAIGRACAAAAPPESVVCRIGGDEFAILLPDAVGERSGSAVAARLRAVIAERGQIRGVVLSAAIGSAECPPLPSVADAVEMADALVRSEKRAARAAARPVRRTTTGRVIEEAEPTIRLSDRVGQLWRSTRN